MQLSATQRQRIMRRHSDSLQRHGHAPQALYWSSKDIQEIRFRILAAVGIHSGDSLLDVGCGFADLKTWLTEQGIPVHYSGLDLSSDLLAVAKKNHPDGQFYQGELSTVSLQEQRYDWLLLSGALNEVVDQDGSYAYATIRRMFALCRRGISLNLLSSRNPKMRHFPDLQSHDPHTLLAYCQTLSSNCRLVEGYLENDFSLYLYRATASPVQHTSETA